MRAARDTHTKTVNAETEVENKNIYVPILQHNYTVLWIERKKWGIREKGAPHLLAYPLNCEILANSRRYSYRVTHVRNCT